MLFFFYPFVLLVLLPIWSRSYWYNIYTVHFTITLYTRFCRLPWQRNSEQNTTPEACTVGVILVKHCRLVAMEGQCRSPIAGRWQAWLDHFHYSAIKRCTAVFYFYVKAVLSLYGLIHFHQHKISIHLNKSRFFCSSANVSCWIKSSNNTASMEVMQFPRKD